MDSLVGINILNVTDFTFEREKLYYSQRNAKEQEQPHGHSLEAVVSLGTELIEGDQFYIYRSINRNKRDKPAFVLKISQAQAQIALVMNQDSNLFINNKYCFADSTFKKCLDFVALAAYTCVGLLRKMVKFCSMGTKFEIAENWIIFWRLFNEVLQTDPIFCIVQSIFCIVQSNWVVCGRSRGLKGSQFFFGKDIIKYHTVSYEKHYMWSVDNFKNALLKISKSGYNFKTLTTNLMTANTKSAYDQVFAKLSNFKEVKPSKRDFLRGFAKFWDPNLS